MKLRTIFINILITLSFYCCKTKQVSTDIKRDFSNRYENRNTNIKSLLDIDGYYLMSDLSRKHGVTNDSIDTLDINMVFYVDGFFAYNFFSRTGNPKDIPNYLKQITINNDKDKFYYFGKWGLYKIDGDTIKVQYIQSASLLSPWNACEEWFKVIDRRTIKSIFLKPLGDGYSEVDKSNYLKSVSTNTNAIFIPLEYIPRSNCWLKKEKWLWENEEDWKKYIDRLTKINKNREK